MALNPLPRTFYEPSARSVAHALLGHFLVRNTEEGPAGGVIVETEAYLADDPACHGYKRETPRNRAMYGPPGHAYVYFIYGNHWCFNTVCQPVGIAEAVLIRAIDPVLGVEWMRRNRISQRLRELTNGPAKLCEALQIRRELDGGDLCETGSAVFVARNPRRKDFVRNNGPIVIGKRIGITLASDLPLRFFLQASEFVSRRPKVSPDLA